MTPLKKITAFLSVYIIGISAVAQAYFSVATDASLLRSLTPQQKFWAFGQTVQVQAHFKPKETVYAWLSYYTNGNFKNTLTAQRKDFIAPFFVPYTVRTNLRYQQLSVGWKHYFKGSYENAEDWNIYSLAGFGLLMAKAVNVAEPAMDTAQYRLPQQSLPGTGKFKRLTFDVGLGAELPLGGSVFVYAEARSWLPASDYPSPYLYNNDTPRVIIASGGLRILFD